MRARSSRGNLFIRNALRVNYQNVGSRADGEQVAVAVVDGTALGEDGFEIFLLAVGLSKLVIMRPDLQHEEAESNNEGPPQQDEPDD